MDEAVTREHWLDIAQMMRRTARWKARRLVHWRDDWFEVSRDMEQDGWERFLISKQLGKSDIHAWLEAKGWMSKAFVKWRYGLTASFRKRQDSNIPFQGLDLVPLKSLDSGVEELVLGCEIMRRLEDEFRPGKRGGHRDKALQLVEAMILNGSPDLRGSTFASDMSLDRTKNGKRRYRIRQFVTKLLAN